MVIDKEHTVHSIGVWKGRRGLITIISQCETCTMYRCVSLVDGALKSSCKLSFFFNHLRVILTSLYGIKKAISS